MRQKWWLIRFWAILIGEIGVFMREIGVLSVECFEMSCFICLLKNLKIHKSG